MTPPPPPLEASFTASPLPLKILIIHMTADTLTRRFNFCLKEPLIACNCTCVRADPAQNLTGFKGVRKKFWLPRSGEKNFLGPLGDPGACSPRKFWTSNLSDWPKLLFQALDYGFFSKKVVSPELFLILNLKDFTWKNNEKKYFRQCTGETSRQPSCLINCN